MEKASAKIMCADCDALITEIASYGPYSVVRHFTAKCDKCGNSKSFFLQLR